MRIYKYFKMNSLKNQVDCKRQKIQGRVLMIIYNSCISQEWKNIQAWFIQKFLDSNLQLSKSAWSAHFQAFVIQLSCKRKLSIQKYIKKLIFENNEPRILLYYRDYWDVLSERLPFHYPETYGAKIKKLISNQVALEDFVMQNIHQFKNILKLSQSLNLLCSKKQQRQLELLKYPKKRGYWLYGQPSSGKTTFANALLGQGHYIKDAVTDTFDGYDGEKRILFDQISPTNSKKLLPLLKNLINVSPARFNLKFSHRIIYPETVIVTTNYQLRRLTTDQTLADALKQRFVFYTVKRQSQLITKATQFKQYPGDMGQSARQLVYNSIKNVILPICQHQEQIMQHVLFQQWREDESNLSKKERNQINSNTQPSYIINSRLSSLQRSQVDVSDQSMNSCQDVSNISDQDFSE